MFCSYEEAAVISYETIVGMVDRLQWMTLPLAKVLCVGKDSNRLQTALQAAYPDMSFVTEDTLSPLSVDVVIAHFALPYVNDMLEALWRYRAYLKPGGLLFCSHLGPDTLQEWRHAPEYILPALLDMHKLGDLLLHAGFTDPVIDVDYYHTRHRAWDNYLHELQLTHMLKDAAQHVSAVSDQTEWITTYEVVFAHAFAPRTTDSTPPNDTGHEIKIPVSKIGRIIR